MSEINGTMMDITTRTRSLPTILLSAVLQGGMLYGLHHALKNHHWLALNIPLMIGLYTCAVLIPVTVQLLAEHAQRKILWFLVAMLTIALFYFGWHFGSAIVGPSPDGVANSAGSSAFLFGVGLIVLWLLVLPFLQSRTTLGHWRLEYPALFTFAWRNKIMLFEAAVFTGLFWLILALWQALFHMLQIDFFRLLFQEPIFAYPVTAIVFGTAMHLIGGIERLVSAVLEQLLNVLKWLAIVAGVLLALFTLALLVKLPGLAFQGQKAIGATWLLWLIAVIVLFLNAAYRDGTIAQPYPRWMGRALRFVVPLTVVIALTACYSLWIREHHHGLTVERFCAFVVAGAAFLYAVGYSIAASSKGAWLGRMAQVNIGVALALIVTIAAALTPLMSPYRLAANSQYQRILDNRWEGQMTASESSLGKNAFQYLRWEAGNYGRERLEQLTKLDHHPNAERIRELAFAAIHARTSWESASRVDAKRMLDGMKVYPAGRTLDESLVATIKKDIEKVPYGSTNITESEHPASGLYVDLNGDGVEEFVIFGCCTGVVYQHRAEGWFRIGNVRAADPSRTMSRWTIETELGNKRIEVLSPAWKDLLIGDNLFRVDLSRE